MEGEIAIKTCTKCKIEKPANTEYFYKKSASKDGLSPWCKDCYRENRKQKQAENKKKIFIYDDKKVKTCPKCGEGKPANTEYFYKNKETEDGLFYTCKECKKEYREKQKAKNKKKKFLYDDKIVKVCNRCKIEKPVTPDYFHRNINLKDGLSNTCKECAKKRTMNHHQKNKEHHEEYMKKYRQENKEWHREYHRRYRLENPEVSRLIQQRRRARKAQLPHTLTPEEWEDALEYFNNECAYCGDSESGLHQEHVIPVVKGGGYTADNIIPACQSCNSSKNARDMEEWYLSYEHYDEDRLNKILDYIIEEN